MPAMLGEILLLLEIGKMAILPQMNRPMLPSFRPSDARNSYDRREID